MSVSDRLNKLTTDITNAYTSIENKGGTIPANKNTENMSTAIDSIEVIEQATAEGESISLANTKAMPYNDYVVKGKSEQATRSGKNLLNVTATSRTYNSTLSVTVNDDKSITLNGTNTSGETIYYRLGDNFTLSAGTYTLSNHNDNCNPSSTYGFYDDGDNFNRTKTSTKTFGGTVTIKPYIRIDAGISINNQIIYPMIEQGSTETDYEQYGASPSPDYPSEIHSVADDVNLLNLENIENHSVNSYYNENIGTNFQLKAGETYTLSFDAESDITPFDVGIGCGSSGNYQSDILVKNGFQNGRISITFTPQNSNFTYGNYLALRFVKYNSPTSYTYSARNIKLQKGTTATPNGVGTVTIKQRGTTENNDYTFQIEPLRSLPNGVKDTIEVDGIHRRVGRVVLDGSENWRITTNLHDGFVRYYISGYNIGSTSALSDYFLVKDTTSTSTENILECRTNGSILINTNVATTLEDFKTWLSTHNTEVLYELAEEVIEPFTQQQAITYLDIIKTGSYNNNTNIYTDEDVKPTMKVDYYKKK